MGKWSYSINGSDFIHDLLPEYMVAFLKFPPEEATQHLDEHVRNDLHATNEEWMSYILSIDLFTHKHGIKIPKIVERALKEIDMICAENRFGQDDMVSYKELIKIQKLLTSPFPYQKKIHLNINLHPVFHLGDVIALQIHPVESFRIIDKYIVMKKVGDLVSWKSALDPCVTDNWPIFQLTDCYMDDPPTLDDYFRSRKKVYSSAMGNWLHIRNENIRF